jgi:hypothetical protein
VLGFRDSSNSLQDCFDMQWINAGCAVVIAGQQFNPTVFNQAWLLRLGVLDDDTLESGSLFSDGVVHVRATTFDMLVIPPQLQFIPRVAESSQQELIVAKLSAIVSAIPHTPFSGLGLNFNWHLVPDDASTNRLSRDLFFLPDRPLYQRFQSENSRFGAYLSKDFGPFRLKLDIKPITVQLADHVEQRIQFAFNFHFDLQDDAAASITQRLEQWGEVATEVNEVISSIGGNPHE